MRSFLEGLSILIIIRFVHIYLSKHGKSQKKKEVIYYFEWIEKSIVIIGGLCFIAENYDLVVIKLLLSIVSIRFLIKLVGNSNFKNIEDLFFSLTSLYFTIINIINSDMINTNFENIIKIESEYHIIQLAIVHTFFITVVFTVLFGVISLSMILLTSFLIPIRDIENIKNRLREFIIRIDNITYSCLEIRIFKSVNEYVNPLNQLEKRDITNIKLIKKFLLGIYVITGIIVIFYWRETIKFIGSLNNVDMSLFLNLPINENDLNNYKLVFVMPLLGILLTKSSSSKEKI